MNSDGAAIHEKYDIKGSWVSRNASPPRDGQMVTCSHCVQKFQYRRKLRLKKKNLDLVKANMTNHLSQDRNDKNPSTIFGKIVSYFGSSRCDTKSGSIETSPIKRKNE